MRLVWVTAIPPSFESGGGGEIRQAHLLDALKHRFEVRLLLAGELRDQRVRGILQSVEEVPANLIGDAPGPMRRRLRDVRWQILQRQSEEVARHRRTRRALRPAIAATRDADIVCVEYIGLAKLLPRNRRGFWALTLHNLTSGMARHNASLAPGPRQRMMLELEERNSRRVEHWAAREYDLVVAVSPDDAAMLPPGTAVVPNGVDLTRFQPSPPPAAPRVVFTGALHTQPNSDGIRWFCTEAWPIVRARVPDATLEIVGARPPKEVDALAAQDGVAVHPDVPDVVPFLEGARVAVVPLRIGTGSRLKALEAMAAARTVVGTTIGVGGLDVVPGRDLLVADDPKAFADAVVKGLTDRELAVRVGAQGRSIVEQHYSWARIGADYVTLLEEGAAARATTAR